MKTSLGKGALSVLFAASLALAPCAAYAQTAVCKPRGYDRRLAGFVAYDQHDDHIHGRNHDDP